jgi:hypothetical protein
LDDREVILYPARVGGARDAVRGDVIEKIAPPQVNFEEVAPMVVVMVGKIQSDGNKGRNIGDCIDEG